MAELQSARAMHLTPYRRTDLTTTPIRRIAHRIPARIPRHTRLESPRRIRTLHIAGHRLRHRGRKRKGRGCRDGGCRCRNSGRSAETARRRPGQNTGGCEIPYRRLRCVRDPSSIARWQCASCASTTLRTWQRTAFGTLRWARKGEWLWCKR
jgi:hypothetical protein